MVKWVALYLVLILVSMTLGYLSAKPARLLPDKAPALEIRHYDEGWEVTPTPPVNQPKRPPWVTNDDNGVWI